MLTWLIRCCACVDVRKQSILQKFCSEYHLTTEAQKLLACCAWQEGKKKAAVLPLLNMFLSCTFFFSLALHVQTMSFKPNNLSSSRCLPSCPHFFFSLLLSLPADLCANSMIVAWFVSLSIIIAGTGCLELITYSMCICIYYPQRKHMCASIYQPQEARKSSP